MTDIYTSVQQDVARNGQPPQPTEDEIRHREQLEVLERLLDNIEGYIGERRQERKRLTDELALQERRAEYVRTLIAREKATPTEVPAPAEEPSDSGPPAEAPPAPSATVHDGTPAEHGVGSLLSGSHPVTPPSTPAAPSNGRPPVDRDESFGKLP